MVTSMEEYMSLRREFLKVSKIHVKRDAVEELKVFYKDAINSARTLDRVEDMEGLLKILEKRGVVRYDLVTPLKHIARKYLHGLGINNRLDSYEANVKSQSSPYPAHTNLYQYGNVHYIPQPSAPSSSRPTEAPSSQYPGFTTYAARQPAYNLPQLPATSTSLQTLSPREAQLQQHVFKRVSERMGSKWTEVARRLGIMEYYIDEVQAQIGWDTQQKTLTILNKFAEDTDLSRWKRTLTKALEDARRKDLRELVEDLVNRQ